ncbi:hypothetical protein SAMN02745119_03382 [Trichlorobacter thiogenes]|uniref:Uncharacterized protein n=1 Tax=Trichlorobacter thiogenes TaxID=115783 RepID=A0A1T4SB25_9BACT|nr:hypothetical protein SAMN02745119_03382 [Trichlorobacter thiogenes]
MPKFKLSLIFLTFFVATSNCWGEVCLCPKGSNISTYAENRYKYADLIVLGRPLKIMETTESKMFRMTVEVLESIKGHSKPIEEIFYNFLMPPPKVGEVRLFFLKNNSAYTCPNNLCSFTQDAVIMELRRIDALSQQPP